MNDFTVEQLIRWAAEQLRQIGLDDPFYEARLLWASVTADSDASPLFGSDELVTSSNERAFKSLLQRRLRREPLQHILGHTGFMNIDLRVDGRALIPRSDTEIVVGHALRQVGIDPFSPARPDLALVIADLGTGSGAILASVLERLPNSRGFAIEASAAAMSLAKENFERLGLSRRIDRFEGSWASWADWSACDLIISNPPYIRSAVLPTLEPEVRLHDPSEALDGGGDGLAAYREIIALAGRQMTAGAVLVLEIGYDQKSDVAALLESSGFTDLAHARDLGGNDRAIAAIKT